MNVNQKDYNFNNNLTVVNLTVRMLEAQEGEKGEARGKTLKKRIKDKIKWKEDDKNKIVSSIRNLWKSWNHRIDSWKRTHTKKNKKNWIVILERI